jgi:hypothetical protein
MPASQVDPERELKAVTLLLFAAALMAGVYQFTHSRSFGFGPGREMVALARNLARHGSFANPFQAAATGPSANQPPLYPFFLAGLMRLFGDTLVFAWVATLAAILIQALHAALLPRLSLLLYDDAKTGIHAAILSIFALRVMPDWDATFTATGLMGFCLASAWLFRRNASPSRSGAIHGMLAGVLLLLNPASILVSAPWTLFLLLRRKLPLKRIPAFSTAFVVGLGLVSMPWMVRNYMQAGVFAIKDNFGITLYASNNPCAKSSLWASLGVCHDANHPNTSLPEARELTGLGEAEYDRRRAAAAIQWMAQNPRRFCTLTLRRAFEFWFPAPAPPLYCIYAVWIVTALSIPGLWLAAAKRIPAAWFTMAVALVYPMMYYVVVSDVRYRTPILWLSLLCAGYALSRLADLARGVAGGLRAPFRS